MDYVNGVFKKERDYIENGTTLLIFQLACREALRHDLVGTVAFKQGLYRFVPDWKDRGDKAYEARKNRILGLFQACFGSVDKNVVKRAAKMLADTIGYCGGHFDGWALAERLISPKALRECLDAVFSEEPISEVKILLRKHRGKVRGFTLAGFSELCYLCRDDLFPVINRRVTIPKALLRQLKRKCFISQNNYQGYPYLAEVLEGFLDELRFPKGRDQHRFGYVDRYFRHRDNDRTVRASARKAFYKELAKFVDSLPDRPPAVRIARTICPTDLEIEGGTNLATHRRKERKSANRQAYLNATSNPYRCKICHVDLAEEYSLEDDYGVIEVHHKRLLKSVHKPNLDELVGLCPNCHVMLHRHIAAYLRKKGRKDFASKKEAFKVHDEFVGHCQRLWR
ncbi:MAG: hypothetical protein E3J72_00880 [Planctomycetota bacterium]|nr:MAG: hypothetical protein E3J72_00880 [Planctomycetota bacterium]